MRFLFCSYCLAVFLLSSVATPAAVTAADKIGVVLLHAKTSKPSNKFMDALKRELRKIADVATPEMAWSKRNYLGKTLEASFKDIDEEVDGLIKDGAKRVFVGGLSMGAAAALAYGSYRKDIAGILMVGPGHAPWKSIRHNRAAVDEARKNLKAGQPGKTVKIADFNQGRRSNVILRSDIAVSWFDPEGIGSMRTYASKVLPDIPVLFIIGQEDRLRADAKKLIVNHLPDHDLNSFIVVPGGHKAPAIKGKTQIREWVANVAARHAAIK